MLYHSLFFHFCHFYTCDKQVLWESAGAFFPRDNSHFEKRNKTSDCNSRALLLIKAPTKNTFDVKIPL